MTWQYQVRLAGIKSKDLDGAVKSLSLQFSSTAENQDNNEEGGWPDWLINTKMSKFRINTLIMESASSNGGLWTAVRLKTNEFMMES